MPAAGPAQSAECVRLTVGSLFSGIGGIDLGLEGAGMRVIWQSEIEPYASKVLAKHWPHVPNLGDITKIDWSNVERPDLICGGFPCQDISTARTATPRLALGGAKSGLWREYRRAVETLRPRWALVENVAAWRRWLPEVRADLGRLGYASLPVELSAGSFGAPHKRPRIFVVAHADGQGEPAGPVYAEMALLSEATRPVRNWGTPPPGGFRVDDGVPNGMDRLRCLGNAVVPQVAEHVGRWISAATHIDGQVEP